MPRVTVTAAVTRTITIPDESNATGLANNFAGMLDQYADKLETDGWWAPESPWSMARMQRAGARSPVPRLMTRSHRRARRTRDRPLNPPRPTWLLSPERPSLGSRGVTVDLSGAELGTRPVPRV